MRGRPGSATAPAARCRKFRRGSFILNLPLASHHSITSSARSGGMCKPVALAVLRFIAKLELGRRLKRKISRLLTFEDTPRRSDSRAPRSLDEAIALPVLLHVPEGP